ncbi:MAG: hypothetical protein H6881_09650 [Rhodobiaceae bacterium]|nr:hypothetical protein [Rhodobiaceae bacterium]
MTSRLYIQLADNGNIRKWQREPFEGGTEYVAASVLSPLSARRRDAMSGVKIADKEIEGLAQFLHDECEWPEWDFPAHSWPDHPDDDGKRGNGYLKIIPRSAADEFRELSRRILSALTDEARTALFPAGGWRYEIKYGPENEANYAWVYRDNEMVATMRTHHAMAVVNAMNTILTASTDTDPVAYGEDIGGKIVSVRLDKSTHCIVPLYRRPEGAKPIKLIPHEIEVLEMLAGKRKGQWGAWVAVCLENMADAGLCTRGPNYRITDAGRVALASIEGKEG